MDNYNDAAGYDPDKGIVIDSRPSKTLSVGTGNSYHSNSWPTTTTTTTFAPDFAPDFSKVLKKVQVSRAAKGIWRVVHKYYGTEARIAVKIDAYHCSETCPLVHSHDGPCWDSDARLFGTLALVSEKSS